MKPHVLKIFSCSFRVPVLALFILVVPQVAPLSARSISYDPAGRVQWSIQPEGQTTSYSYDANGNLLSLASLTSGEDTDGDGLPDYFELKFTGLDTALDPSGDEDGDGLSNFVEFAFGRTPGVQDGHSLAGVSFEVPNPGTGETFFSITYIRPSSGTQHVDYGVRFTSDLLIPWTTGTPLTVETQANPGIGGMETVTVRYLIPIDALDTLFLQVTGEKK